MDPDQTPILDDLPPPPVRPSVLFFFVVVLLLYVLPGQVAQASSVVLGLAWTEIFVFLLPAVLFAASANLRPATFLLLARRPSLAQLLLGLLCGAASFGVASVLMAVSSLLLPDSWVETFDLTRLFRGSPVQRATLAILASILAPLCEEAAFRGYLQNTLLSRFAPRTAIVASAFLFAAMHLDPVRFIAVLVLGLLFGWLTWRSGSLWPAVAAHAANNGIATALTLSGLANANPQTASPKDALLILLISGFPLLLLMNAYRSATSTPLRVETVMDRRDPADTTEALRVSRISPIWIATMAIGGLLLVFLGALTRNGRP